ncbi:MAG: nitroreductase family protein [Candidatus Puniceispirillum sp.]|nr:nitroreductase family protein [Candidatus Puniceispirillum sp.]
MHAFDAIYQRRAIRHFDPTHRFTKEEFDQLIELGMQAPSSFNLQHWRVVNVTDPDLRKQVRSAAWDQAQVTDASLLFVITTDIKVWQKNPGYYLRNAPKEAQGILLPLIAPFYEGKDQLQRDEAMRSVGLFMQTLMIAAKAMGYDSCPMIGFDPGKVAELIHLPADHAIGALLTIGKRVKDAHQKSGYVDKSTMLIENHF